MRKEPPRPRPKMTITMTSNRGFKHVLSPNSGTAQKFCTNNVQHTIWNHQQTQCQLNVSSTRGMRAFSTSDRAAAFRKHQENPPNLSGQINQSSAKSHVWPTHPQKVTAVLRKTRGKPPKISKESTDAGPKRHVCSLTSERYSSFVKIACTAAFFLIPFSVIPRVSIITAPERESRIFEGLSSSASF